MSEPPKEVKPEDGSKTEQAAAHAFIWREIIAGLLAVSVGVFDIWHFGRDAGLSNSIDELLVLTGIALIAGIKNLFSQQTKKPGELPQINGNGK